MRADQLTDPVADHGEGPCFSSRWGGVRWMDMVDGCVLELTPSGEVRRRRVDRIAALVRPRRSGGFVVAGERELFVADGDDLFSPLTAQLALWDGDRYRLNEGGCDPAGGLYIGSLAYDNAAGAGSLYRVTPSFHASVAVPRVTISNGLDWSPDSSRAYYVDSMTRRIDVFDWTPERGLESRRAFAVIGELGLPDGLTVDAEGHVWVAIHGAGVVHRYTPAGDLDGVIELPVSQVTAVTFGGPELDTVFITTSRHGVDDEPLAGSLFTARPGVRGMPVRDFAG